MKNEFLSSNLYLAIQLGNDIRIKKELSAIYPNHILQGILSNPKCTAYKILTNTGIGCIIKVRKDKREYEK